MRLWVGCPSPHRSVGEKRSTDNESKYRSSGLSKRKAVHSTVKGCSQAQRENYVVSCLTIQNTDPKIDWSRHLLTLDELRLSKKRTKKISLPLDIAQAAGAKPPFAIKEKKFFAQHQ
jgi:hypothetical protein